MTMLEKELRDTFDAQPRPTPVLDDPATAAIGRARRIRRRRAVAGSLAAVLMVLVALGGTLALRDQWREPAEGPGVLSPVLPPDDAPPQPSPGLVTDGALDAELRAYQWLWTADGARVTLGGSSLVQQAFRTPHGLLYGSQKEIQLRSDDGTVVELADGLAAWLPSPDGTRVAYTAGGSLAVAPLLDGSLGEADRVKVPSGAVPVRFWGSRVVVSGPDGFAVAQPGDGAVHAAPDEVAAVYGPVGDDLLVLVGEPDGYCLAEIGATAGLPVEDELSSECPQPVPVTAEGHGWLSPDGAWLAVPDGNDVWLLEVSALRQGAAEPVLCPRRDTVQPTWQDATTLLSADDVGAVRCDVAGEPERLALPPNVASRWEFVPTLG